MTSEVMLCHRCGVNGEHMRVSHATVAAVEELDPSPLILWRDRLLVSAWMCLRCRHSRTRQELCPYGCDDRSDLRSDEL